MKTDKLYYSDLFRKECEATVLEVNGEKVICNQTVAFPEGGGQIGDVGIIICNNGEKVPFVDTKKGVGEILNLNNSHDIQINTPVFHIIDINDSNKIVPGEKVKISIDVAHRIKTTALHSALHIALMAAVSLRPELKNQIKGCQIDTEKARIDFFSENKFSTEDIIYINDFVKNLIIENVIIERYLYEGNDEAWIWKCKDFECPCGGTHVLSTGQLGKMVVKRKNVGKTTERLIVSLENIVISEKMYH